MKKILVSGYYGYQNSGDDAILHSICHDIKQLNIESEITVLSNQPHVTMSEYSVNAVDRFNLKKVIKQIKNCDVLVMGGGTLIQDLTSTRSLYYYLGIIWMAKFYKKKVMLYGNGIGSAAKHPANQAHQHDNRHRKPQQRKPPPQGDCDDNNRHQNPLNPPPPLHRREVVRLLCHLHF